MSTPFWVFMAGALSGVFEAFSVQPFDMIKTRHQLNVAHNESVYRSLVSIYQEGGIFRFYRGMSAELLGMIPKSSAMYATYELVKRKLISHGFGDTMLTSGISGFCAGFPESLVVQPFQVVKVRLQAKEHLGKYTGSFDCATKLMKQEGLKSFTLGLGPTIYRNCVWNTVYFAVMHKVKNTLPSVPQHTWEGMGQTFVSGFFGAFVATCFNAPFDVVKSRFQSQLQLPGETPKYTSTFQTLRLIYQEEGLGACYKGFRPKAIRMALGGAVAMTSFELFLRVL